MHPDKAKQVMKAYKAGIMTVSGMAKEFGVSRSAVYRLVAASEKQAHTDAKNSRRSSVSSASSETSASSASTSASFEGKVGRFADDLGLPDTSGQLQQVDEGKMDDSAKEAALDSIIGNITGESAGLKLPPGLEAVLETMDTPVRHAAAPVPQTVHVISADRATTMQKIIFNVQHFGALLEPIIGSSREAFISSLSDLGDAKLRETLATLERTRSVGNMASGFKQVFFVAAQATEATSRMIGMKARGFTDHLRAQEEEITMIMKELAIDQWEKVKVLDSPQARLGVIFCMTLLQVDAKNRMVDQMLLAASKGNVDAHVAEVNKDL